MSERDPQIDETERPGDAPVTPTDEPPPVPVEEPPPDAARTPPLTV